MADRERRDTGSGAASRVRSHPGLTLAVAGAAALGVGLFLWGRSRELQGEESTEDEIEAHPS